MAPVIPQKELPPTSSFLSPGGPCSFLLDGGPQGLGEYKGPGEGHPGARLPVPGLGDKIFLARSLGIHQPEAMLLWLTLTLLWSTTCWAKLLYGNGGGTYFSTPVDEDNDITGIRVSVGPIGLIKRIQVKHGSNWSEIYGVSGGKLQEFLLWPGEHITAVYGMHRIYIRYLFLYTDIGRWVAFGKEGGHSLCVYPEQRQKVLTGLYGRYKGLGLTGIGFKWDYPRKELDPEEQSEGTDG